MIETTINGVHSNDVRLELSRMRSFGYALEIEQVVPRYLEIKEAPMTHYLINKIVAKKYCMIL